MRSFLFFLAVQLCFLTGLQAREINSVKADSGNEFSLSLVERDGTPHYVVEMTDSSGGRSAVWQKPESIPDHPELGKNQYSSILAAHQSGKQVSFILISDSFLTFIQKDIAITSPAKFYVTTQNLYLEYTNSTRGKIKFLSANEIEVSRAGGDARILSLNPDRSLSVDGELYQAAPGDPPVDPEVVKRLESTKKPSARR